MLKKIKRLFDNKDNLEHREKNIIHVIFVDFATEKVIAQSNMPHSQLPKSFEAATTLHILDGDWEVIKAKPMTSEEFIKSGKLTLTLGKINVSTMPPGDLLYSLPTISNEIPGIIENSSKLEKNTMELHEDDWRQIDILPESLMECIVNNLEAIKSIYQKSSKDLGDGLVAFKKLHVRTGLDNPFYNKKIHIDSVINEFESISVFDGISLNGIAGIIEGGFAINIGNDTILYGLVKDNFIESLSLYDSSFNNLKNKVDDILLRLKKNNLCIVDWCKAELFISNGTDLNSF